MLTTDFTEMLISVIVSYVHTIVTMLQIHCLFMLAYFVPIGCPSLICITINAEILVYSLPALRPVVVVPFTPLNDLRYVHTYNY